MSFAPRKFLRKPDQIRACNMVMVANLATAHAGEEAFRVVRVRLGAVLEAIGFLVVDPVKRVPSMKRVPRRGFVGVKRRAHR